MRTGYLHEAVCYSSDEELLTVAVPFLRDGVADGEPTVVTLGAEKSALIRSALSPSDAGKVVFHSGGDVYARPAAAIRAYREMFTDYLASGANEIRVIGELPPSELGATWDWWARYESAINHAYGEFPLWTMCAYDARTTPATVLADVARTHPHAAAGAEHVSSTDYQDPHSFLVRRAPVTPDPLQLTTPAVDLTDPAPSDLRRLLAQLNRTTQEAILSPDDLGDLQLAATEALTNGLRHGKPPVTVRAWAAPDRIVLTVTDRGDGPQDPFAGLQAAPHAPRGGVGLWLAHQLCDHVALHHGPDGFTLRLISGNPYHRVATH